MDRKASRSTWGKIWPRFADWDLTQSLAEPVWFLLMPCSHLVPVPSQKANLGVGTDNCRAICSCLPGWRETSWISQVQMKKNILNSLLLQHRAHRTRYKQTRRKNIQDSLNCSKSLNWIWDKFLLLCLAVTFQKCSNVYKFQEEAVLHGWDM